MIFANIFVSVTHHNINLIIYFEGQSRQIKTRILSLHADRLNNNTNSFCIAYCIITALYFCHIDRPIVSKGHGYPFL